MAVEYDAKAALFTLLGSASWTSPAPQVAWSEPTESEDQTGTESVYLGPILTANAPQALGWGSTKHEFSLLVAVDVRTWGDDLQATEARAWVLSDNVISVLRSNHSLTGTVHQIAGYSMQPAAVPSENQWRYVIHITIDCRADFSHNP